MTASTFDDAPVRARIPADLDTPDRLLAGLTARQLALLGPAALLLYCAWQGLAGRVPLPVLAAALTPVAGLALAVAVGRRDGAGLDGWLMAALAHRLRHRRLIPAHGPDAPAGPDWAPAGTSREPGPRWRRPHGRRPGDGRPPGVLRLPAEAISSTGVISTSGGMSVVLVAASTITTGLQTPVEEAALLAGYARWLNSLAGPVQVVVSARRAGVGGRALHVAQAAQHLPHPALARAAIEHAEHLLDLCEDGDPLTRTVTIACTAPATARSAGSIGSTGRAGSARGTGARSGGEALRRAERTAAALSAAGSRCRVLDGGDVTAVLAAAADPFGPADTSWPRTPPGVTVTAARVTASRDSGVPGRQDGVGWDEGPPAVRGGAPGDWDDGDDGGWDDGWDGHADTPAPSRWSR